MKQLKLAVVNKPQFDKVLVKVSVQTHRGSYFGDNFLNTFTASNGFVLGSNLRPAKDDGKTGRDPKNTFWVRGYKDSSDDITVAVSRDLFNKLVVAVKEYNEFFSVAAIYQRARMAAPAPRPAAGCTFIIG